MHHFRASELQRHTRDVGGSFSILRRDIGIRHTQKCRTQKGPVTAAREYRPTAVQLLLISNIQYLYIERLPFITIFLMTVTLMIELVYQTGSQYYSVVFCPFIKTAKI